MASGQTNQPLTYKIEIRQWGLMMVGDISWTIMNNTISISRKNINGSTETYSKSFSKTDEQTIIDLLKKINIEKNKKNIVKNAPDDMGEYDFKLSIDQKSSEFHLYQVRIEEVFNLVKQINNFLPEKYHIGYNDDYFRFMK